MSDSVESAPAPGVAMKVRHNAVEGPASTLPAPFALRPCGRPTKSGRPCRSAIVSFTQACRTHATEDDVRLAALLSDAYCWGFDSGRRAGRDEERRDADNAARERERAERLRLQTDDGEQIVKVGRYAYAWAGRQPLEIGDLVRLPANEVTGRVTVAEVTDLGTDYVGALRYVLGKVDQCA